MGDRGNIAVRTGRSVPAHKPGGVIVFYTHWAGTETPQMLQAAIAAAKKDNRLDDDPYLARIIFSEMTKEEEPGATTGYGISNDITDNEHPILLLDQIENKVHMFARRDEDRLFNLTEEEPPSPEKSWSIDEYLALDLSAADSWPVLTGEKFEDD